MKNSMTELVTDAVTETVTEPMLPSDIRIPPGTCVAIVAPGGYAPDEAAVERGIALLEAQGCKVKSYYDHSARHQRFGATDIGRAAHIQQAAADPEVQIVMALRGAYGVSRILPALNYRALAASGKFLSATATSRPCIWPCWPRRARLALPAQCCAAISAPRRRVR